MDTYYSQLQQDLVTNPKKWLVIGVAGFIDSNLLKTVLKLNQRAVGLDNFATDHERNLSEVQSLVSAEQWATFNFIKGDIRNLEDCHNACQDADYILHQRPWAACLGMLKTKITTISASVTGFLNMLVTARNAKAKRFVYDASCSTYGDHPGLLKVEVTIGNLTI